MMPENGNAKERNQRAILVAVADTYERNYASMLLQRFGYHVYSVDTYKEAAEFVSASLPQLVLADEGLATGQGRHLLNSMKQMHQTAAIPVILLTTADEEKAKHKFGGAGYAALLIMPLTAEALYRTVQKAIEPYPRGVMRVSASVGVSIGERSAGFSRQSIVLSENGMFLRTVSPLLAGTMLPVSLLINDRVIATEAVVLYSHGLDEYPQKEMGMGMRFETIRDEDKAAIRFFVREEIERGISKK